MKQRDYTIQSIIVNSIKVSHVIIDDHYKEKHGDYMSDSLILNLVKLLDGRKEAPDDVFGGYSYFATLVELDEKQYRLVWRLSKTRFI
jgi:hypothetical protein